MGDTVNLEKLAKNNAEYRRRVEGICADRMTSDLAKREALEAAYARASETHREQEAGPMASVAARLKEARRWGGSMDAAEGHNRLEGTGLEVPAPDRPREL